METNVTCPSAIIGIFPYVGMDCQSFALYIGFVGLLSAYIFWSEVVK